jgi:hypothetical protein
MVTIWQQSIRINLGKKDKLKGRYKFVFYNIVVFQTAAYFSCALTPAPAAF